MLVIFLHKDTGKTESYCDVSSINYESKNLVTLKMGDESIWVNVTPKTEIIVSFR